MPASYHSYLLQIIKQLPNNVLRAKGLCSLAPLLSSIHAAEVLKIVETLEIDFYRALVLREVAPTLPLDQLEQTTSIAQSLEDPNDRMVAACGIASHWPDIIPAVVQMMLALDQGAVDQDVFADLLRVLIPTAPETCVSQILTLIETIQDPATTVALLIQLLPRQPQLLSLAFQKACNIRQERSCALALGKLIPRLTAIDLQLALQIIEKFENKSAILLALQTISSHHPSSDISLKLIPILQALPIGQEQCQAISAVLPCLPQFAKRDLIALVSTIKDRTIQAYALCHLAARDKTFFPQALHAISLCPDSSTQFTAYWILGQRWSKLVPIAFNAASEMIDPSAQASAFHQLAPHLSDDQLDTVFAIAKQTRNQDRQHYLLNAILPYCSKTLLIKIRTCWQRQPGDNAYGLTLSTLKAQLTSSPQTKLHPQTARQMALRSLTSFLPEDLLSQTLVATFEFADQTCCAKALINLLPQLHPEQIEYPLWCRILRALTHLEHEHFLASLPKLMPMLYQLAGPDIHHSIIQNLQMIRQQWS